MKEMTSVKIPLEIHKQIKLHCVKTGKTIMDFLAQAAKEKIANDKKK